MSPPRLSLTPPRPLLVTADPQLLDELLRLCAAAGVEPEVALDPGAARAGWSSSPLVLVGRDVARQAGSRALPRRADVVLVSDDLDDAGVWELAVTAGCERVVFLPDAQSWLVERLADAAEGTLDAATVCVLGGRGGAGATSLAVALALTGSRRGLSTVLIDADPFGGGIDLAVGGEDAAGMRWPDLATTSGRVNGHVLCEALPRVEDLHVLSWDRGDAFTIDAAAMGSVLAAAARASDLVVLDLPRRLDQAAEVALAACSTALLLVPAEVRATAAAARVAAAAGAHVHDLRVVVRGPAPGGLSAVVVAEALGLPLAGAMRAEPRLAEALERGEPPGRRGRGPIAVLCERLLDDLVPPPGRRSAA